MHRNTSEITYFGKTNFRNDNKQFGIYQWDRAYGVLITGATNTGKSHLMHLFLESDLRYKRCAILFDIHNDLYQKVLQYIPNYRKEEVIQLDFTDSKNLPRYNLFRRVSPEKRILVASGVLDVLKNQFKNSWGDRIELIFNMLFLTLLDQPKAEFKDCISLLYDEAYRNTCIQNIQNEAVINFWKYTFPRFSYNELLPVSNKIMALLGNPLVRAFLSGDGKQLSFRRIMDKQMVLVVNLSKGTIGDSANILAGLLLTSIVSAGFSRVDLPPEKRTPVYLYLDESASYVTLNVVEIIASQLRKFGVHPLYSCQYLSQYPSDIRDAILGNVGTIISFRTNFHDARLLTHIFHPVFAPEDFINLPRYHIYLKMMINGTPCKAFSAVTLQHPP